MRSERSETFRDSDGEYRTRLYTRPINFKSGDEWKPIDNTLIESGKEGYAYRNAANSFRVHFKDSLEDDFMRFEAPGGKAAVDVSLEKADDVDVSKRSKSGLSYRGARKKTDIRYDVVADGVKETVVLHDADAPSSYVFRIEPEEGQDLMAVEQPDGSILFFSKGVSRPAFSVAAPTVSDSDEKGTPNPPAPDKASMKIEEDSDGNFRLEVSIEPEWLADPGRVFPVYLDPTYNITVQQDAYYVTHVNGTPSSSPPTASMPSLYAGRDYQGSPYYGYTEYLFKFVTTFDLATIPVGVQVTGVTPRLFLKGCTSPSTCAGGTTTGTIQMRRLTNDWLPARPWNQVTSDATVLSSRYFNAGVSYDPINTWYALTNSGDTLRSNIQSMINGQMPNYGFLFEKTGGNSQCGFYFGSSRQEPPAPSPAGPFLDITWLLPDITLNPEPVERANGADLTWTRSSYANLQRYEIHRSTSAGFTPSASTLIATIADRSLVTFRDTTAKASTNFYYKVVSVTGSGSFNSNEIKAELPAAGTARVLIQPGLFNEWALGTYINPAQTSPHTNDPFLLVSQIDNGSARALLKFDTNQIPSNVTVSSAQVKMYTYDPAEGASINAHLVTSAWNEDATYESEGAGMLRWQMVGGDYDASVYDNATDASSGNQAHWLTWDVGSIVQSWLNGTRANNGLLFKYQNESGAGDMFWLSDDFPRSVALRPKLTVNYSDPGATVISPQAAISSPAPGSQVKGTVIVKSGASDDGKVASVQFKLDGANLGSADTSAPYEVSWNTTSASRGSHTLTAVATDNAGNSATSSGVAVTVANSNVPTVSVTGAAPGASPNEHIWDLTATASDDYGIDRVDFLVDGKLIDTDTASPWTAKLNTLSYPAYDGTHQQITARAWDGDDQATTSAAQPITVANGEGTLYQGSISIADVPDVPDVPVPIEMRYDPDVSTQDDAPLTVAIENDSLEDWLASDISLRYRWLNPDGSVFSTSGDVALEADVPAGTYAEVPVTITSPELPASTMRGRFTLRIDLYETSTGTYFAAKGNQPLEQTVTVTRVQADELGLERYQQYDSTELGSNFGASVNLANGNLVVESTLSRQPGIGLDTVAELNYNSLEQGSVSPVGNNWSLAISGLTPFGLPLDIHPNAADEAAGRTEKWIGLTDGDGSYHRFTLNEGGDFYDSPPGVHLYARKTATGYIFAKPDRTTFKFDEDGYPTSVVDKNGNQITFTETVVPVGDDINGLTKQITAVTDKDGRSYQIGYFNPSNTARALLWGKVSYIADHLDHRFNFAYYDDGNLMSVTEEGGQNPNGSNLPDRSVVFAYTNPEGTGPAIATLPGRRSPSASTTQSTRLYSVIDARGNETSFAYVSSGEKQWRVSQVTNRAGVPSSAYDYNLSSSETQTTVTQALARVWSYKLDSRGRLTEFTSPLDPPGRKTTVAWTGGNNVSRVTEPTGEYVEYEYNQNGYQTSSKDELGHETTIGFQNLPADDYDTENHISRITWTVKPEGNTTPDLNDYKWTFGYSSDPNDKTDNVLSVTDPSGSVSTSTYKMDNSGLLATQTQPNAGDDITRTTTYNTYDQNGLPTSVTDAAGGVASAGYDAAGNLLWQQDPNHQSYSGGDGTQYQSHYYYDSYGRVGRTSTPKSSSLYPGLLIWEDTAYDANDNVLTDWNAHYGIGDGGVAPSTTSQYDALDRPTVVISPRGSRTQTFYDNADRVTRVVNPNGYGQSEYFSEARTSYDLLDRAFKVTQYAAGQSSRTTTYCYDLAGDLRSTTEPLGASQVSSCPGLAPPYTPVSANYTTKYVYDAAHRMTQETAPDGTSTHTAYDANGQVVGKTDENGQTTTTAYNGRGLPWKTIEPFDSTANPDRMLTTISRYDALGRIQSVVSPRAFDVGGEDATKFVTSYSYDALNRQTKTSLPVGPTGAYYVSVMGDSPNQYWRLGETSGTTAANRRDGGAVGTYFGSPTLGAPGAAEETNTAVNFNGSSSYMQATSNGSIAGSFTVEAWVKPESTANMNIFSTRGPSEYSFDMQLNGGNKIHGDIGTGSAWLTTAADANFTYQTNAWYLIAYVVTPSSYTIYANGKQVGSGAISGMPLLANTTHNYYVGQSARSYAPQYFDGSIDEVAVYNGALSSSSIKAHYESGVPHYIYQSYDANGNQTMVSQETSATSVGAVAAADKTTTSYLDSGAIYSTYDGSSNITARYDYTAEGWQSARYPDTATAPGTIDFSRTLLEDYYGDGQLFSTRMLNGRQIYTYDASGNQTRAVEGEGVVQHPEKVLKIERTFNGFNEETKTVIPSWSNFLATSYAYDQNGRTTQMVVNAQQTESGSPVAAGRTFVYTYDQMGRVLMQTDDFYTPSSGSDDEKVTYTYTPTSLVSSRTLLRAGDYQEQKAAFTYFDNGLLNNQKNYSTSSYSLIEEHTLSYISSGVYMNGNKTSDVFKLLGPDETAPCRTSTCTATWGYDAEERLIYDNTGTSQSYLSLDASGNLTASMASWATTTKTYSGQKLTSQTSGQTVSKYIYDAQGNVDCVVSDSATTCPAAGISNLVEDYSYDGLNRQRTYNRYSGGTRAYSTTYLYDALNRVVREIEDNTSVTTSTDMQYEGDSTRIAKEGLTYDGWSGGPNSNSKTFAYEAGGQAITMTEWPAGQSLTRLSYLYDPGSSISLLIDEVGIVKESYGYSAYGSKNSSLTKTASGFSTGPTPTNPIRFQGKRFDSGSGSYDMGARRYSPGTGRWLQQDFYYDALDNLGLSQDPLTANRYAFLGGNPVNYVEVDGHRPDVPNWGKKKRKSTSLSRNGAIAIAVPAFRVLAPRIPRTALSRSSLYVGIGVLGYDAAAWLFPKNRTARRTVSISPTITTPAPANTKPLRFPDNAPDWDFGNPAKSPGEGWEWRGEGKPGSREGAWYNPRTGESIRHDTPHGSIPEHWDYKQRKGKQRKGKRGRVDREGNITPKRRGRR